MNDRVKNVVEKCLNWLEKKQFMTNGFHKGGFSPYPETVKSAGTLATSDVLTFLQRSNIKKGYIIDGCIEFLLRVQIHGNTKYPSQSGGFPPLGDFELILNTAFTDSTADAVLGLLSSLREIGNIKYEKKITEAIRRGIEWLLKCYRTTDSLPIPTYFIEEEYNVGPRRYFPTVLTGIAFITYRDYCKRMEKTVKKEINEYIDNLRNVILNMLKTRRNIPLADTGGGSLINTILGIEFLYLTDGGDEKVKESLEKGYNWLKEQYSKLLKSNENHLFTEYDPVHIDIPEISEGDYPATYFTLPPMARLLAEYPHQSTLGGNKRLLNELISKLLDLAEIIEEENVAYYYEYRGRKEPATSATVSAIYALKVYNEKGGGEV